MINPDSAANLAFTKNLDKHNYSKLTHPDGFVTIGVILLGSDTAASCPGFSSGPPCMDTIWFHYKIKLVDKPNPAFSVTAPHICESETAQFTLKDTSDTRIRKVQWNWGDGNSTTINLNPGDPLPGTYSHQYIKNGANHIQVLLENDLG